MQNNVPFDNEDNVLKIKAKEIIMPMAEPPSLQELADEIGLNLKKLKWVSNKFMAILFMDFYLITKWILPENYLTVDLIM
jgi:hypothetical protein